MHLVNDPGGKCMVQAPDKVIPSATLISRYLQELGRRVLFYDGAMGTSIQNYDLSAADFGGKEGCNEYLVIVKPDLIEEIHSSFLEIGCDVVETNTFGGSRLK